MVSGGEWSLEFYADERGRFPARAFVDGLDERTRARLIWSLEQLRVRNSLAREPLVKHLEGNLWELREQSANNIYRVFYFFFTGRRIVILHAFQKKTQKTPRAEIVTARSRREDFIARQGGGQRA